MAKENKGVFFVRVLYIDLFGNPFDRRRRTISCGLSHIVVWLPNTSSTLGSMHSGERCLEGTILLCGVVVAMRRLMRRKIICCGSVQN